MKKRFTDNEIIGNKKVLKFIAQRGEYTYYRVQCLLCGRIRVMNGEHLRRRHNTACIVCGKKDICLKRRKKNA